MLAAHRISVGSTTPVDLTNGEDVSKKYEIRLRWPNGQTIYLGAAAVSGSDGFTFVFDAGDSLHSEASEFVAQMEDERLYAIAPSGGGTTVQVLMFSAP